MTQEHPFNKAFDELQQLLKQLEEHANQPLPRYVDPKVVEELDRVCEQVDQFEQDVIAMRNQAGLTEKDVQRIVKDPSTHVNPQQAEVLSRSTKALKEVNKIQDSYNVSPEVKGEKPINLLNNKKHKASAEERKSQKARSNKFRRLGGGEWKAL